MKYISLWLWFSLALHLFLASSCATRSSTFSAGIGQNLGPISSSPEIQAALARLRAAEEEQRELSVLPEAQLRVRDISANHVEEGRGVGLDVRMRINEPWVVASSRKAGHYAVEAETHRFESIALDQRGIQCIRAVADSFYAENNDLFHNYRQRMEKLLAWNTEWSKAGTLDGLEATRAELRMLRRLEEQSPGPAPQPALIKLELPQLSPDPNGLLDASNSKVRQMIERNHPQPEVFLAEAQRYEQRSRLEWQRLIPWFDWVQVGYEPGAQSAEEIETTVAIRFPLDVRAGASARRMDELQKASEFDREAAIVELSRRATQALSQIRAFEARSSRLKNLLDLAQRGENRVDEQTASRRATPRAVSDLLDESYRLRLEVLRARASAAESGCSLLTSTGLEPSQWPRMRQHAINH